MKLPINIKDLLITRTVEWAQLEFNVSWTTEVTTEVTMEVAPQVADVKKSGTNL